MCGIAGLFSKSLDVSDGLGRHLGDMLLQLSDRGPDSAGVAVYREPAPSGSSKVSLFSPDPEQDWGAVTVEPYQLVPLMRVARSLRPRLLIADDTGLGKTAEAGLILRWLAQRHEAKRILVVTRATPEPERWQREL